MPRSHLWPPGVYVSHRLHRCFSSLGRYICRQPLPFLLIPILITLFSCVGLLRFYEENRIWYLYSPSNAPSHVEHAIANEFFDERGGKFWLELPVMAHDTGNLLRNGYLEAVEDISNYIMHNLTVPCEELKLSNGGRCSFRDLCTGPCNDNQAIPIFSLIYRNQSQRLHPNFRLTFPTMHLYNDEYYVGEHFSGVDIDSRTNRISAIRVIVLYYRTDRQNAIVSDALSRWEMQLLQFITTQFQHPLINITASSDGIISHEVRRNGISCIPYFTLSVLFIFLFIFITSYCRHANDYNFDMSNALLIGIFGTAGPLMAVGTTFNLMFLIGLPFNSITLVMPFLIIGVGCDDVFIIVHAWQKTANNKYQSLEDRIAMTMEEAGPSISITSLTNGLSFIIGAFTSTPAIRLFCLYTAVGVIIDYIYQITFFVTVIVYEGRRSIRQSEQQQVVISCANKILPIDKDNNNEEEEGIVSNYCRQLSRLSTRLVLFCIVLIYWTTSIIGCYQMELRMDSSHLILGDSPLHTTAWIYDQFLWRQGSLVYIFVNRPPDLSKFANQQKMLEMIDRFERLEYSMGKNSTSIWLRPFMNQAILYNVDFSLSSPENFSALLHRWLDDYDNGGGRWNDFIRLNSDDASGRENAISKFLFATGSAMGSDASWSTRTHLQNNWRRVANAYSEFNVTVFQAYSFYVDQLNSIGSTTASTVLVALITMAVACLLMIPNPKSVISSLCAMISINVGVFGYLSLWNVNLDPITMCTTLMSIGFSVDFTAHISYHYYRGDPNWPADRRLADALRSIGWPMIQAGASTVLCILPLLLVDSYMVHVFVKTIVLVISLGLIHGIVFLPMLLLSIGGGDQSTTTSTSSSTVEKTIHIGGSDERATIDDDTITKTSSYLSLSRVHSLPPTLVSCNCHHRSDNNNDVLSPISTIDHHHASLASRLSC